MSLDPPYDPYPVSGVKIPIKKIVFFSPHETPANYMVIPEPPSTGPHVLATEDGVVAKWIPFDISRLSDAVGELEVKLANLNRRLAIEEIKRAV